VKESKAELSRLTVRVVVCGGVLVQSLSFELADCRHWEFMLLTDEHAVAAAAAAAASHTASDSIHLAAGSQRFQHDVDDVDQVSEMTGRFQHELSYYCY